MKWRFAGRFLLTFAALVGFWWATDFADIYRHAVLLVAQVLSPIATSWHLQYDAATVTFHRGGEELAMLLQITALSMGLMPFLSLVAATPGQGLKRGLLAAVGGSIVYLLLDVVVVLLYPFIMERPNVYKDTLGVFSGLLAFVVAPLALWFVFTYPTLRSVWRLNVAGQQIAR